MQEIFVAIIMIFDAATGQLAGAATAAFADKATCETVVAQTIQRSQGDMQIAVEGECIATPLLGVN
jgi:hypothetical protein